MAGIAETTMARLRGAFVVAHLQVELAFVSPKLLLGEGTFVLLCHLWS